MFCRRTNVRSSIQRDENFAGSVRASPSVSASARKLRRWVTLLLVWYTSAVLLKVLPPNSPRQSQLASIAPHVALLLTPRLKSGLALPTNSRSASVGSTDSPL